MHLEREQHYQFHTRDKVQERLLKANEVAHKEREMPHFALHRRNSILLFYGVSEIFLRLRKIPI